MKKTLKDYLKTQFKYEPISFENKEPLWMHTEIEKRERKAAGVYLLIALFIVSGISAIVAIIALFNSYN